MNPQSVIPVIIAWAVFGAAFAALAGYAVGRCQGPAIVYRPVSPAFVGALRLALAHSERLKRAVHVGNPAGIRHHQERVDFFLSKAMVELVNTGVRLE